MPLAGWACEQIEENNEAELVFDDARATRAGGVSRKGRRSNRNGCTRRQVRRVPSPATQPGGRHTHLCHPCSRCHLITAVQSLLQRRGWEVNRL